MENSRWWNAIIFIFNLPKTHRDHTSIVCFYGGDPVEQFEEVFGRRVGWRQFREVWICSANFSCHHQSHYEDSWQSWICFWNVHFSYFSIKPFYNLDFNFADDGDGDDGDGGGGGGYDADDDDADGIARGSQKTSKTKTKNSFLFLNFLLLVFLFLQFIKYIYLL